MEDNELNAEIAREILRMTGIDVECAIDGIEAVKKSYPNFFEEIAKLGVKYEID